MATTTRKSTARQRVVHDPAPCRLCPEMLPSETDLVIHLVEEHSAVWTSTTSFGLDDLVVPAPREAYEDTVVDESGWVRRLVRRTG